jgi:putative effector of murein hydrolase
METARQVAFGTIFCGVSGMVTYPVLLRLLGLSSCSPLVQGLALGSVSHVSVMAALGLMGEATAAEGAALAFFLLGTCRCLFLQMPFADQALMYACGSGEEDGCASLQTKQ